MIIGIDATRANDPHKTGVGWYAWHVIEEMKKISDVDGLRVILYSDAPLQGPLADLPSHWSSKVLQWPPRYLWTQIRLSWEMLVHPPDVLYIPAHVFPFVHPKKTIMTIHDIAAAHFPKAYSRFERWYSLWSAARAVKTLFAVLVPSSAVKHDLVSRYGARVADKIHVTPLACDVDNVASAEVLHAYGIHKPYFVSVSRLEEKKNTKRIVRAFDQLCETAEKEYQLVLIGRGGYGYEEVAKAIDKSPNKDRIILPTQCTKNNWVPMKDVYAMIRGAAAFVYPSLYEGFGIPILEAFALGTPVVTSNAASMPEVGGNACLYVNPHDVTSIADAMSRIAEDQSLAQQLRAKGKKRLGEFSWKQCAKKTFDVLVRA